MSQPAKRPDPAERASHSREPADVVLDRAACTDLETASRREWLETDGLGGFACGTVAGLHTRRYHGLLVAATRPPVGRMVLLSKLDEALVVDGVRHELSTHRWRDVVHPQGYRTLVEMRLDPYPIWVHEVGGLRVVRRVLMVRGEPTTLVRYEVAPIAGGPLPSARLELAVLVAFRDYHATTHVNTVARPVVHGGAGWLTLRPYADAPALHLAHDAVGWVEVGDWYRSFLYEVERERGLDAEEDLLHPVTLVHELGGGRATATVIASTTAHAVRDFEALHDAEVARRAALVERFPQRPVRRLVRASDAYVARRGERFTVLAGFPWFTDWGRDTMIALPGLALATGRFDVARSVLATFAEHLDRGMLPNRFPDGAEPPEHNTVDATLWFAVVAGAYVARSADRAFARALLPRLLEVVDWHDRGTRHGIHVDSDGLLACGEPGVQLTWMDAKVGDWVVTPRHGKPVEVQALWHATLCTVAGLAGELGEAEVAGRFEGRAARVRDRFREVFWNPAAGCLYDVVPAGPDGDEPGRRDASIRPNQILAVSLGDLLERDHARAVVDTVERELLTPFGLRSLSPRDAAYRPRYEGDPRARDGAYHQGTVWPWLMGPFVSAYLRVNDQAPAARRRAAGLLAPLVGHLDEAGLGHVSEVFDGSDPHRPGGCFAQAWSVAELLRLLLDEGLVAELDEVR